MNRIFPVFIPHAGCPFRCVYCDQNAITGTDTPFQPTSAAARSLRLALIQFIRRHHFQEKEVAFYGGTFTALPDSVQEDWFRWVNDVIDHKTSLRISTRPDCVSEEVLERCHRYGVRTLELGVQSFDDNVLSASERGYNAALAEDGCRRVLEHRFELGIQLMPGLPDDSPERFFRTVSKTIELHPQFVRLYPTIVLAGTGLAERYAQGLFSPWSLDTAVDACADALERCEAARIVVAKMGLHSDIPAGNVIAGPYHRGFGELVRARRMFAVVEKNYRPGMALIVSAADISLLKGIPGRYCADFLQRFSDLAIFIDKNRSKGTFMVMENIRLNKDDMLRYH